MQHILILHTDVALVLGIFIDGVQLQDYHLSAFIGIIGWQQYDKFVATVLYQVQGLEVNLAGFAVQGNDIVHMNSPFFL